LPALIEAAIDAVKDYLSANMAAKLDVLDAEYGDFVLADIQRYYIAELSEVPEQPAILVLGDRSTITEAFAKMRGIHTITVAIVATDQDAEQLRRRLYRYARAIVELMQTARGSIAYMVKFESLDYSPIWGKGDSFLQDARVILAVEDLS
jgi:hypothetical protein